MTTRSEAIRSRTGTRSDSARPRLALPGDNEAAGTSSGVVRQVLARLTAVDGSTAQTVIRLTLGGVMLPHGLQKAFGLFGGSGFGGTMEFLTAGVGLPWLFALLVIAIELVGSAALLAGLFSRLMAAGVVAVMIGATVTTHLQHGFFMNWSGAGAGEGFEFHLLAIGIGVALMLRGGGAAAVDGWLHRRLVRAG